MTNVEQLQAELRATMRAMAEERDEHKRRELLGECENIEATIAHEERLLAIAAKYGQLYPAKVLPPARPVSGTIAKPALRLVVR